MINTSIRDSDLAVALIAKMAEKSGISNLTCTLTDQEVLGLVGKFEVIVTRKPGALEAKSIAYESNDEYTIEFRAKATAT